MPVFFTTIVYDEVGEAAAAVFLRKVPALRMLRPGSRWVEIDPRLGRLEGEPVIVKARRVGVLRRAVRGACSRGATR